MTSCRVLCFRLDGRIWKGSDVPQLKESKLGRNRSRRRPSSPSPVFSLCVRLGVANAAFGRHFRRHWIPSVYCHELTSITCLDLPTRDSIYARLAMKPGLTSRFASESARDPNLGPLGKRDVRVIIVPGGEDASRRVKIARKIVWVDDHWFVVLFERLCTIILS